MKLAYIRTPIGYTAIVTIILSIYSFVIYKNKRLERIKLPFNNDQDEKYIY